MAKLLVPIAEKLTLTVPEAAALTGFPERYIYDLLRKGELPCVRTGGNGKWHVSRRALDAWVARMSEASA